MLLNCSSGGDSSVPWTARRSNQSILKEINPEYSLEGLMLKLQYFAHLMQRADVLEKTLMLGKISGQEEKRTTEGEIVGWYHRVNEYEFQPTPGDSEGGGACRADKESDDSATEKQ